MVSDMATRIRNAIQVRQASVKVYNTVVTQSIASILLQEGFISGIVKPSSGENESSSQEKGNQKNKFLVLQLKYTSNLKMTCLTHIQSVSKPGVRMYSRANERPRILGGLGIMIISTSKGIVTDKKAREEGVGGELLCSVW